MVGVAWGFWAPCLLRPLATLTPRDEPLPSLCGLLLGPLDLEIWSVQQDSTGGSSCVVAWCPVLRGSVCSWARKHFRSCFSEDIYFSTPQSMASLQNPKSLHCDSPTGTGRKLYMASFPTTGTYLHHHRVYQIIWAKGQRRL